MATYDYPSSQGCLEENARKVETRFGLAQKYIYLLERGSARLLVFFLFRRGVSEKITKRYIILFGRKTLYPLSPKRQ